MAPITSLFAAMLIFNIQLTLSELMSCTTVEGTMSTTGDDDLSSIECPAETPIMVSCGYYGENGGRDGGYISGNKCYAQNGSGGNGAKPYARCCSIIGGAECIDESDTLVNPADDTKININCPSDYQVTGCTVQSWWKKFDGILPYDGNYCQLHSSTVTLNGYARCCKPSDPTTTLSCNIVSTTSTGLTGSVSCSSGVMTGCSAVEIWNQLNQWYVDGNTCHAERLSSNGRSWTIKGICCDVFTPNPTESPSPDPTINPTADPSADPTSGPTIDPTEIPTPDPTNIPTEYPTNDPSYDPTSDPTRNPSKEPTTAPTPAPTLDGCDFDIDAYLEKCYCVDNGGSAMGIKSPFDQYTDNRQNYFEPRDGYNYNYNPKEIVSGPNDDLILNILYMNSFAIMVILGYLVYINGCSRRMEGGYEKVYDTEYDHVSERHAINA